MSIQCPACLTENPDGTVICIACGYSPLEASSVSSIDYSSTKVSTYHLPSGTLLKQGNYQVEQLLGEGGFGITYKGIYLQNSSYVAIKELWPEKAARQGNTIIWPNSIPPKERHQQLTKFKLEAKYLYQCTHQNIVQVYEWFEENNTAYIIMEFISGKSLSQISKYALRDNKHLSEDKVTHYFIQIAEALKVVHSHNFLHRDIKPENILVDNDDRAVLIDFGATREFIAGQTSEASITLTAGYAPYEQYSYRSKRFPATDFYALCASMYEVLTGQLPVESADRASTLLQGNAAADPLVRPRQLRPDLSSLIERVILTGMRINVQERFQSADELIDALKGKFVSPCQRRAQELVKQNKLSEAVQAYESCLSVEPNNHAAAVELALVQVHLNDAEAKLAAQRAIHLNPDDGRGYGVLGLVNCRQKDWITANENLQQAARLAPNEAWIYANLAWALGKTGYWQEAEVTADRAIQIDSNCIFAYGIKAWIFAKNQDWKATIRAAKPAIFKSKRNNFRYSHKYQAWIYPYLAVALEKAVAMQQSDDVERCIEEFTTQIPDSAFAWGLKGWKSAIQKRWKEAISELQNAANQPVLSAWALVNLGVAYEYSGNIQNAMRTYEFCSEELKMHNAFAQFRLGTLLAQQEQWRRSLESLEKAIELKPDYAEAYHNLAWALANLKYQDGEVEHVREILTAYKKAVDFYVKQNKNSLAESIKTAFFEIGMSI